MLYSILDDSIEKFNKQFKNITFKTNQTIKYKL